MNNKINDNFKKNKNKIDLQTLIKKINTNQNNNEDDLIPIQLEFKLTSILNKNSTNNNKNSNKNNKKENNFSFFYKNPAKIFGGLNNIGNTCFINSVLQSLIFTRPLQNYLIFSNHVEKCKIKEKICFLCEFSKFLRLFQKKKNLTPFFILKNIKLISKNLKIGRQEDAHEFLIYFLDVLERNFDYFLKKNNKNFIVDDNKNNLIKNIFEGELKSEVQCLKCKNYSKTNEKFITLSLDSNSNSIEKCLSNFFKSENLINENKIFCEKCKKKNDSKKKFFIKILPNILIIHLKRFDNFGRKIQKNIKNLKEIDLNNFTLNEGKKNGTKFKLYSILVHSGFFSSSGHYFTFLNKNNKNWVEMNDNFVQFVNENYVMNQNGYLFFYEKINENLNENLNENSNENFEILNENFENLNENKKNEKKNEIYVENIKIDVNKILSLYKNKNKIKLKNNFYDKFLLLKNQFEKEKNFLNKKRKNSDLNNNKNEKKIIFNKKLNELYKSNNIELWENDSNSSENNLKNQINFIKKTFKKTKIKQKSDYDINLDKGKQKKIKKHKKINNKINLFQNIQNKNFNKKIKNK